MEATGADMGRWATAVLSPPEGALGQAVSLAIEPRAGLADPERGLAWVRVANGLTFHNGGTGGFRSALAVERSAGRAVLALVASANADHVDQALVAVLSGADPTTARPEPVGEEWREPVEDAVRLIVARDWAGLRARMTSTAADALTADVLDAAWGGAIASRGAVEGTAVRALRRRGGAVVGEVDADHVGGARSHLVVTFDADRRVAGLLLR